jgi:hypothetical protein
MRYVHVAVALAKSNCYGGAQAIKEVRSVRVA